MFLITLLPMQSLKSRYFNCYDVELAVFNFSDLDSCGSVDPYPGRPKWSPRMARKGGKINFMFCFVFLRETRCISWSFDALFGDLREII